MKTLTLLPILLGMLIFAGCRSYQGGTGDDYNYRYGTERSSDWDHSTWPTQPSNSPLQPMPQPLPPP